MTYIDRDRKKLVEREAVNIEVGVGGDKQAIKHTKTAGVVKISWLKCDCSCVW